MVIRKDVKRYLVEQTFKSDCYLKHLTYAYTDFQKLTSFSEIFIRIFVCHYQNFEKLALKNVDNRGWTRVFRFFKKTRILELKSGTISQKFEKSTASIIFLTRWFFYIPKFTFIKIRAKLYHSQLKHSSCTKTPSLTKWLLTKWPLTKS